MDSDKKPPPDVVSNQELTDEELEAMLDEVLVDVETQATGRRMRDLTDEEIAARAKEAGEEAAKKGIEGMEEVVLGIANALQKSSSCADLSQVNREWRTDKPPEPKNRLDVAVFEYFWQRGATIGYHSKDGRQIEYTLKGWHEKH